MEDHEFVLWYGCQRVGAEGLHWILRPALHIAFEDLFPTAVPLLIRFSLGSVLAEMITTLDAAPFQRASFPLNTFSLT